MSDDIADARLETEIRLALDACLLESDQRTYRALWSRLASLIAQRSPQRVARMERVYKCQPDT